MEAPRAGLPDAEKLRKRGRRLRFWVWASVFLLPVALALVVVLATNAASGPANRTEAKSYAATQADAVLAVRQWLGQDPAPLPGGQVLGWRSATERSIAATSPDDPGSAYKVQVHTVAVASADGSLFDAVVALGVSDTYGVARIGTPSLLPLAPSDDTWQASAWGDRELTEPGDAVEAAIAAWAAAYSSGDPSVLRLAVGDGDPAHAYVPLAGAKLTDLAVGEAYAVWPADVPVAERDGDPPRMVVQVSFQIAWSAVPATESNPTYPQVTYDVLVAHSDSAAPAVVAWGGPGSGPSLRAFGNAVSGRDLVAPAVVETPAESVAPTPTPEPTKQPAEKTKTKASKSKAGRKSR